MIKVEVVFMNKNKLFLLVACSFLLTGCFLLNRGKNDSSSEKESSSVISSSEKESSSSSFEESSEQSSSEVSSEESSESESSSSIEREPLNAPVVELNLDMTGLTWNEVDGAVSYTVTVNETQTTYALNDDRNIPFKKMAGNYNVSVVANADVSTYDSLPSNIYSYETCYTSLGELTADNGVITWNNFVGYELTVKELNDTEEVVVNDDQYIADQNGIYTFTAKGGYDNVNNIFYFENASVTYQRTIVIAYSTTDAYVLEDAEEEDNATLQEQYTVTKYSDGWVDSTATISLDGENERISRGKCAKFSIWQHGTWFRFDKDVSLDYSYDTLSFYAKGDGYSNAILSFDIKDHVYIGSNDLIGVYITYQLSPLPTAWTKYSVSMDDPNWVIDYSGTKINFATIQSFLSTGGIQVNHLGDLLPYFDGFQFRLRAAYAEGGPRSYAWFDEVKLSNTGEETSILHPVAVYDDYAFESTTINGTIHLANGEVTISSTAFGIESIVGTYETTDNGELIICVDKTGSDVEAVLSSPDGGVTFVASSVTGTAAPYFENLRLERYTPIDNFESYESTGVGYDVNHAADERSGLRANYYCDYYDEYTSATESPMGGTNWHLMGSTDYLNLVEGTSHSSTKYARFKYVDQKSMRYTTYGLSDGTASIMGKGNVFSFWAKGSTNRDIKIKLRLYTVNSVIPSTQQNNSLYTEVVIPQNSGWTEYKVDLTSTTTYYGFAMTLAAKWDGINSSDYIYIDDICIYNNISPWGE